MGDGVNRIKPTALALLYIKFRWHYYIIINFLFFFPPSGCPLGIMEKTDKMEVGVGGGGGGLWGCLYKNRMASPKVKSKLLPDTPQISLGF
jgi:hypothetical protein